jgi:hypothetical protein
MYQSIVKYIAAASLLLSTASCGRTDHCYPGYAAGGEHSGKAIRTTVVRSGTAEEVAENHGVSLDSFLKFNEADPDTRIETRDKICIEKR